MIGMPFDKARENLIRFAAAEVERLRGGGVGPRQAREHDEPHKVVRPLPFGLDRLVWWIRGVPDRHYRSKCSRCGRTGQLHVGLRDVARCLRFRPYLH